MFHIYYSLSTLQDTHNRPEKPEKEEWSSSEMLFKIFFLSTGNVESTDSVEQSVNEIENVTTREREEPASDCEYERIINYLSCWFHHLRIQLFGRKLIDSGKGKQWFPLFIVKRIVFRAKFYYFPARLDANNFVNKIFFVEFTRGKNKFKVLYWWPGSELERPIYELMGMQMIVKALIEIAIVALRFL